MALLDQVERTLRKPGHAKKGFVPVGEVTVITLTTPVDINLIKRTSSAEPFYSWFGSFFFGSLIYDKI